MRSTRNRRNLVSFAGWLYADVLLVVALIGFGSVVASARTPRTKPPIVPTTTTTTTTTIAPENAFQLHCREFIIKRLDLTMAQELFERRLKQSVAAEIAERKLNPSRAKIGIIYVYGYGDSDGGTRLARDFKSRFFGGTELERVESDEGGAFFVTVNGEKYKLRNDNGGGQPEVVIKGRLIFSGPQDSECD
jgi:hypothetical protein